MTEKHLYGTGIVGNCAFIAHVNLNTNISWLCWPRFDSSFVFGSLLDKDVEKGGEFSILPQGEFTTKQYYVENTNVLRTEITAEDGSYRVTDFAPRFKENDRYFKPLMLIRKIEPLQGNPRVKVKCKPVYDYGKCQMKATMGSNHIIFSGDTENMQLSTNVSLN
ncbi:MAG: glycoside hydrolase family 15 protein, partial [Chitinophagaceae bacterium]